mgnify:CR=1 FL=1
MRESALNVSLQWFVTVVRIEAQRTFVIERPKLGKSAFYKVFVFNFSLLRCCSLRLQLGVVLEFLGTLNPRLAPSHVTNFELITRSHLPVNVFLADFAIEVRPANVVTGRALLPLWTVTFLLVISFSITRNQRTYVGASGAESLSIWWVCCSQVVQYAAGTSASGFFNLAAALAASCAVTVLSTSSIFGRFAICFFADNSLEGLEVALDVDFTDLPMMRWIETR